MINPNIHTQVLLLTCGEDLVWGELGLTIGKTRRVTSGSGAAPQNAELAAADSCLAKNFLLDERSGMVLLHVFSQFTSVN